MTTPNIETPEQRVARLVLDVQSGDKTLAQIRQSVDRLAGLPVGDYSNVDDSAWLGDPVKLAERVTSIFGNRGVPLERGAAAVTAPPPTPGTPVEAPPVPVFDAEADARQRQERDAFARLDETLAQYGLGGLGGQVRQWLVEGVTEAEVPQRLRETQEYKTRFAGLEQRRANGLSAIDEGQYIAYERTTAEMMRAAGLPQGFYDSPDDFARFIGNGVSPTELGDRITLAANAALNAPQEVRDALAKWGVGPGELTAYWLDPDKTQPLLERKYAAAQLAGTATRTGFGSLSEDQAGRLASVGTTVEQAEQGFGELGQRQELFASLDSSEDQIGQDEQLAATFEGSAAARRRIEQRARKRAATFGGGGGFASSQQGLVGLGDAQ